MIKRFAKNIISIFATGILFFCLSFTAFADPLTGGLIGIIDALGITIGGIGITAPGLNDIVGDPTRTDIPLDLVDSSITYTPNSITIDDVVYDEFLFSPQYAAFLRDEGLGWIVNNDIDSNSSGIISQGLGFVGGVPIFQIDGVAESQQFLTEFPSETGVVNTLNIGDFTIELWRTNFSGGLLTYYSRAFVDNPITGSFSGAGNADVVATALQLRLYSNQYHWFYINPREPSQWNRVTTQIIPFTDSPFTYNYVAGAIDTSEHEGDSLRVLIPHGYVDPNVQPGTHVVDGGPGNQIINLLNQAIVDAKAQLEDLLAELVEIVPPTPPPTPTPLPTDALGSVPYPTWMDTFGQRVKDGIETINDTIGLFKDSVEDFFDTVGQGIQDALEDMFDLVGLFKDGVLDALDTWGQSIEDAIDDLGTLVNTGITSLRQILEAIRTAVASIPATLTQILEHIRQGHLDLFKGVLDAIKVVFAPILIALKSALRLWHYVVEWVQATAPVFSTFIGFMSGTSYNMVLPIYAALAGPICIAIYKRFGR